MAKFNIYSSDGTLKASGYPVFTGTYMKPGVLEFREIASPVPIEWEVGDYVDYDKTGFRYTLYSIPQVKRQARNLSHGATFVYQNVLFHDASYILSIVPFRDLVPGDNRVHFSTQSAISVYADVAHIAERVQACLDLDYGGKWIIRTAADAPQSVRDLMEEYREFVVSNVTLMGVLEKIYEVWTEIGWIYETTTIERVTYNVITIGGAGRNIQNAESYMYGKGHGLLNLTRTSANQDELANRIYAYGSTRNMLSGWYRSKNIKDAESVDIQHLMLPIHAVGEDYPGWGRSVVYGRGLLPDPAKAYVEDGESISRIGLREKMIYFDGSGDTEEIYPTIQGMTIGEVRSAIGTSARYYPRNSAYPDGSVRVDKVLSVQQSFDSGLSADMGKQSVVSETGVVSNAGTLTSDAGFLTIGILNETINIPESGTFNLYAGYSIDGTIECEGATVVRLDVIASSGEDRIALNSARLEKNDSGEWVVPSVSITTEKINMESGQVVAISAQLFISKKATSETITYQVSGDFTAQVRRYREKVFRITIRQIGFDINEQAAIGDGKTIFFRTGKCAGRSFVISQATYQYANDTWILDVIRSEDESLSQWFPNADYPIDADDEFVLLDIAMPDSYVEVAERRLLSAAQDYLEWSAKEQWQYAPEIDAKFMKNEGRRIMPADYMFIVDTNLTEGSVDSMASYLREYDNGYYLASPSPGRKILLAGSGYAEAVLVDSITISESESPIPTYKVTLRDRKRKTHGTYTPVQKSTPTPVTNSAIVSHDTTLNQSDFFEEDGQGGVKLKDEYKGLSTIGFLAAGGIGRNSESGGGIDLNRVWESLTNNTDKPDVKIHPAHIPDITISKVTGLADALAKAGKVQSVVGQTGDITVGQIASALLEASALTGYATETWVRGNYLALSGGTLTGDLRLKTGGSNYGSTLRFGDGDYAYLAEDEDDHLSIYASKGLTFSTGSAYGIKYGNGVLKWDANNDAWHLEGNFDADGFISAGGVASSSDRRLKDKIEDVCSDRALAVLMALRPKEWFWNEKNDYFSGKRGAGLVAQDVEDVLPFAVMETGEYKSLNYSVLHAYEIAGLQNHEERIAELEKENQELKRQLEAYATR